MRGVVILVQDYRSLGVAITGASGIVYGLRFVEVILKLGVVSRKLYITFTDSAEKVALHEEGMLLEKALREIVDRAPNSSELAVTISREKDFSSPLASSSSAPDAFVIIPCSIKTLGEIVHGISSNIVVRAALSMLRLRRTLVVVPRETPLGTTELELMLELSRRGAIIVPAMPGFYHRPRELGDLVDFVVGKVLDVLGVEHSLYRKWGD